MILHLEKSGWAELISGKKKTFQVKGKTKDKDGHFSMMKWTVVHQENITIIYIYTQPGVSYIEQLLA